MATTLEAISAQLDELGVKHTRTDDGEAIVTSFTTDHYRDLDGDASLFLVIRLEEHGEYFKLFAPRSYKVSEAHRDAFLRACAMVQYRTKLIQFEWNDDIGVLPIVEFPLEDAPLTTRQLHRCIYGMVHLIDEYHDALALVAATGQVDAAHLDDPELARFAGDWEELLETFPPSVLEAALERARQRRGES